MTIVNYSVISFDRLKLLIVTFASYGFISFICSMFPTKTTCLITLCCFFLYAGYLRAAGTADNFTEYDSINLTLQHLPDSAKIIHLLNISDRLKPDHIAEGLTFAKQALAIAASVNDSGQMGTANLKIASLYLLKGVYEKSLAFALEAIKLFEDAGMEKERAQGCELAGKIYRGTNNPVRALDYFEKALTINRKLNRVPEVARIYTSMGSVNVNMDSIDKGLSYYLVAFMIIDSLGMEEEKTDLLIRLGDGYLRLEKFEESLKNYYQAMELAGKNGNTFLLAQSKSRIGRGYLMMNNLPAAMKYARESLMLANEIKTFSVAAEAYRTLAEISAAQGNYRQAFEYHTRFKAVSDSLLNEEKIIQIGELQAKYDMDRKEKENEWLRLQNINKSKTIRRIGLATGIIVLLFVLSVIQLIILLKLNNKTQQLNLKLARQSKELEEMNDQKDKFFAFVAHNLKNPFTTILGFSELIVKNLQARDYEKIDRHTKHILGLSVHVHKILENLLEWSRLQRRGFEYKPEKTDVAALIRDVLEMNHKEAVRKEIEVSYDLPENLMAFTDKFMVTTILQNLMSNALNFTPSSGKIHVTGTIADHMIKITVADSGIGIAKEDLEKLFRIDVHPAKIGTAESKGAGLGLIICRELVQHCQGEIAIDSQLSRGTTVTFTLPVTKGQAGSADDQELKQPDVMMELKSDMERTGKLPEAFADLCTTSLIPRYNEVRSILSLENIAEFALVVETAGRQYDILSFVSFGRHLSTLVRTHQIDSLLRFLPEFKKMTDAFVA